ncbi:PREDICTED: uncharacterized protein LOC106815378 [Priapulus caudatus]|uniref:Uncharacterized protein LOC106815378 n=1 Tax=Priapulus caudatus TaxID=37621 RepID=A0ABM1ESZ7_PRICU|nr:PREDICTED: uncharacterized protein LOC106815378 [Priapulus caudatus]
MSYWTKRRKIESNVEKHLQNIAEDHLAVTHKHSELEIESSAPVMEEDSCSEHETEDSNVEGDDAFSIEDRDSLNDSNSNVPDSSVHGDEDSEEHKDDLHTLLMFTVVVFKDTNEVELVASNWLKKEYAYWPPLQSSSAIGKAVRDRLEPDLKTWSPYKIRVLCTCHSYEDGRKKVKRAEETSDVQTDDGEGSRKRKRKPPQWLSDSEEEDDAAITCALPSSASRIQGAQGTRPRNKELPKAPRPSALPPHQQEEQSFTPPRRNGPTLSSFEREMVKAIATMQTAIDGIAAAQVAQRKLLGKVLAKVEVDGSLSELPEDIKLPLDTVNAVEELERKLDDSGVRRALVHHLSLIGGSSIKEFVRRVMSYTLGHEVALLYNWAGRIGWKSQMTSAKRAFGNLQLCSTITSAAVKQPGENATVAAVQKEIMIWLRNSGDRHGGRKRRERERAQEDSIMSESETIV